jgi:hypothetical protein
MCLSGVKGWSQSARPRCVCASSRVGIIGSRAGTRKLVGADTAQAGPSVEFRMPEVWRSRAATPVPKPAVGRSVSRRAQAEVEYVEMASPSRPPNIAVPALRRIAAVARLGRAKTPTPLVDWRSTLLDWQQTKSQWQREVLLQAKARRRSSGLSTQQTQAQRMPRHCR